MSVCYNVSVWFEKKIGAKCEVIEAAICGSGWLDEAELYFLDDFGFTTPRQHCEFVFKNMSVSRKICCVSQPVFKVQFHPEAA